MRLRMAAAAVSFAASAGASPRFAPVRDGVPVCACEPAFARSIAGAAGARALVVSTGDGPLTLVGAPGKGPSAVTKIGDASLRTRAFAVVDVDADGQLDVFAPSASPGGPAALFIGKKGTFADESVSRLPALDGGVVAATWGDLDGDGFVDLVVARESGVQVLLNDGKGAFKVAVASRLPAVDDKTPVGSNVYDVIAMDVDDDFDLDLVVLRRFGRGRVFENDGKATFTERAGGVPSRGAVSSRAADFADIDGSGHLDLVVTGAPVDGGGPLSWLLGSGFSVGALVDDRPGEDFGVRTVDATGDGGLDVVAASSSTGALRLLAASSIGLELQADAFPAWGKAAPASVFDVGDFDRDGWPDVFGARRDGTTFFFQGVRAKEGDKQPHRSRQGGFWHTAPDAPVTIMVGLRDGASASTDRPFERFVVTATRGEEKIEPLFVRHVGGDLVRVELPAMNEGDALHFEGHVFDASDNDLLIGPGDVVITANPAPPGEGQPGAPEAAAPSAEPASEPSAWSCAVTAPHARVGFASLAWVVAIAFGAHLRRQRERLREP